MRNNSTETSIKGEIKYETDEVVNLTTFFKLKGE